MDFFFFDSPYTISGVVYFAISVKIKTINISYSGTERESFVNRWLINWSEKMPKRWLDWLNVYLYILRITRIEAKYFDGLYKLNFQHAHKNSCVLKYHHRNQPFIVEQSDCKHALNEIYIVICVHGMRWCTLKVYLGCNYTNLVKPFGICALLNYK